MRHQILARALRVGATFATAGVVLSASACSLVLSTGNDASLAAGCTSTAQCLSRPNGDFHICKRASGATTGVCVSLQPDKCQKLNAIGDWQDDNAVIFGGVLSKNQSAGLACEDAIRMAIDDFGSANGLPPLGPGQPRRPLAYVGCSDEFSTSTARDAVNYLVDTLGVPAIIGAEWSGITINISAITIAKNVLLISPGATSIQITALQDNGLVWRTSPSDIYQAATTVQYVSRVEKQLLAGRPTGSKIKVAIAFKGDSYGRSISDAVLKDLRFNGLPASDPGNNNYFLPRNYGDPSDSSSMVTTAQTAAALLDFAPDIVILLGTEEGITDVLKVVETQWSGAHHGVSGPRWILGDGGLQTVLYDTVGTNDDLRRRITGTVPGTSNSLFQTFKDKYNSKFTDKTDPEVFGAAGSYDSVYMIAYSAASLGVKPLTGPNLASGFANLVAPVGTNPVDVGYNGISSSTTLLQNGGMIDLNGASGALEFDLTTGEAPSDIQIWCMPKDSNNQATSAQFSGLYLDAVSKSLIGDIGPICQFN
jgi:branched-chain amino acid transport system substrate-binding protein